MAVELNHTIVHVNDPARCAGSLAEILGLPKPTRLYHFHIVELANGASLDFLEHPDDVTMQHYAFLISETEFDEIFARIVDRNIEYYADPGRRHVNQIGRNDGGRGFYWTDESTHLYEVLTRPYGSGG